MMKKILNDPYQYVDEMLAGLCSAHPELYRQAGEAGRAVSYTHLTMPTTPYV